MKRLVLAAMVIVLGAGADDKKDEGKKDLDLLKGTWKVTSMIVNGKEDANASDHGITFDGEKVTIKEKNGESKGTCKIDTAKEPKQIDLTPDDDPDKKIVGIYSLKDDELKLCLTRGAERPTEFESKEGSKRRFVVLKREK